MKVTRDRQAYLDKLKTFQAITQGLGVPVFRIWRATLAGGNTELLYVATEYPSAAAWAKANAKVTADPEATKFTPEMDASGMRTVIDRSLMVEATMATNLDVDWSRTELPAPATQVAATGRSGSANTSSRSSRPRIATFSCRTKSAQT